MSARVSRLSAAVALLALATGCAADRSDVVADPAPDLRTEAPPAREVRTGVPMLMDLPLVNVLFGSRLVCGRRQGADGNRSETR